MALMEIEIRRLSAQGAVQRRVEKAKRATQKRTGPQSNWPIAGHYWDASGSASGTGKVRRVSRAKQK
jgi:hypothetical protein